MRRALLLLLVVVLPLKALAAGIVPIIGAPGYGAEQPAQHVAPVADSAAAAPCPMHAAMGADQAASDGPVDALHDHACPHLAMASVVSVVVCVAPDHSRPRIATQPSAPLSSIVLDVPSPPPTVFL